MATKFLQIVHSDDDDVATMLAMHPKTSDFNKEKPLVIDAVRTMLGDGKTVQHLARAYKISHNKQGKNKPYFVKKKLLELKNSVLDAILAKAGAVPAEKCPSLQRSLKRKAGAAPAEKCPSRQRLVKRRTGAPATEEAALTIRESKSEFQDPEWREFEKELQRIPMETRANTTVNVLDYHCTSPECMSEQFYKLVKREQCETPFSKLVDRQPTNGCGFIAASIAAHWLMNMKGKSKNMITHETRRLDYSDDSFIDSGMEMLGKDASNESARITTTVEVNKLFYAHCHNESMSPSPEYGGAVSFDNFLKGFLEVVRDGDRRIWVVNTQNSSQGGSHWFAVGVAPKSDDYRRRNAEFARQSRTRKP